ncbi:hypothetical protein KFD70_00115 [Bacillus pfraonensis]|uniref:hypothetical protein n=1 Tax=Bacillus TaxID=1386 RepID=UPI002A550802|nr:hypothetical protein [Bacillus pseudomycoides]
MNQTFDSTSKRDWLKDVHQIRKNRSVKLGKRAIDILVHENLPVTLKTISEKSKEIDVEGKGIHPNTITTNQELNDYYKQHSITYKQKLHANKSIQKSYIEVNTIDHRRISTERNLKNVKVKYMKLSKKELVQRLIQAEQYIAENNKTWVTRHFEKFK